MPSWAIGGRLRCPHTHIPATYLLTASVNLPTDYTRCMGLGPTCPQRTACARHRDIPSEAHWLSWARNLNPSSTEPCPYFIEYQP